MSPGDKHFSHTGGRGGGTNIFTSRRGPTFLHRLREQTSYIEGGGGGYEDKEMDVSVAHFLASKANNLVSEASKLSAGARICRGP